jgi:hypothetical protein
MNILYVPYLASAGYNDITGLQEIFALYNGNVLLHEPWPLMGIKPAVQFNMAYGDDAVFLQFSVKEKYFKTTYRQTNQPVYKDSCVEFFIAFGNDKTYYNFEFNALGTATVGYGTKNEREYLPAGLIDDIKVSTAYKETDDILPHQWELTLAIPFNLFCKHQVTTLKGAACRANFYKCGDDLPEPHFLCWNNIVAPEPDFHLPQYFGKLIFE